MWAEVLLVLLGKGSLDWFSSAEIEFSLLQWCIELGNYYKKLEQFADNYDTKSIYVNGLRSGLNRILSDYKLKIVEIEKEILQSLKNRISFSITYLRAYFSEYQLLFPEILRITTKVTTDNLFHCGDLLNLLYSSCEQCGIPFVKSNLELLFHSCSQILYQQLTSWMLHGLLVNESQEFFIDKLNLDSISDPKLSPTLTSWNREYLLNHKKIPIFISISCAEKILFIGKAVKLLQKQEEYQTGLKSINFLTSEDLLQFTHALRKLSEFSSFQVLLLENVVDKIRAVVAQYLWKLIVTGADLIGHLKTLKDFCLLGKGDFYLTFMNESRGVMLLPPNVHAEHDINTLFQQASSRSYSEEDPYFDRLTIKLEAAAMTNTGSSSLDTEYWDSWPLSLYYSVEWPLELLISPDMMKHYNKLFRFVFKLKRVELELERQWMNIHMISKPLPKMTRIGLLPIMLLHKSMFTFIQNLQYYLHVGVIETQWTSLEKKIHESADFESVKKCHEEFLLNSLTQSFLQTQGILSRFAQIFQLCLNFCATINMENFEKIDMAKIAEYKREFNSQYSLLTTMLLSMRNSKQIPQLDLLLVNCK